MIKISELFSLTSSTFSSGRYYYYPEIVSLGHL